MANPWNGFRPGRWQQTIDVRDFIQRNYTPYTGDESFLAPATERTQALMKKLNNLFSLEREFGGVLDIDTTTVTSLLNYKPGYLDKDREIIVGLQTDRPLKRGVNPFGGIRMARSACKAYGYELSPQVEEEFRYRTTHNDGVFRVYNDETKAAQPLAASSPVCRMPMAGDGSLATIAGWLCTVLTAWWRRKRRISNRSASRI